MHHGWAKDERDCPADLPNRDRDPEIVPGQLLIPGSDLRKKIFKRTSKNRLLVSISMMPVKDLGTGFRKSLYLKMIESQAVPVN